MQCDAFAALSVAYLVYNPFAFLDWLERIAQKFPNYQIGFHSVELIRREVVLGVLPGYPAVTKRRISPLLSGIKTSLEESAKPENNR